MRNASVIRERHTGSGKGAGRLDQPRMSIDLSHLLGDDDLNKPKTERLKKRRRKFIALGVLIMVSAVLRNSRNQRSTSSPLLRLRQDPSVLRFFYFAAVEKRGTEAETLRDTSPLFPAAPDPPRVCDRDSARVDPRSRHGPATTCAKHSDPPRACTGPNTPSHQNNADSSQLHCSSFRFLSRTLIIVQAYTIIHFHHHTHGFFFFLFYFVVHQYSAGTPPFFLFSLPLPSLTFPLSTTRISLTPHTQPPPSPHNAKRKTQQQQQQRAIIDDDDA